MASLPPAARALQVYEPIAPGSTDTRPVPNDDPRYAVARLVYYRGLSTLESPEGLQALTDLGRETVLSLWDRNFQCLYPTDDTSFQRLPWIISRFLNLMRNSPPELYLTNTEGEAMTVRNDWTSSNPGFGMQDWLPEIGGYLLLNARAVSEASRSGRGQPGYSTYIFSLVIGVAHELCHFLTGVFTGLDRPPTPPGVAIPGQSREAGFYWELHALGGIVVFYADQNDRTNPLQPGVPYLFEDLEPRSHGRRVSSTFITEFVNWSPNTGARLPLPVRTSSSAAPIRRSTLGRQLTSMSAVRDRANRANRSANRGGSRSAPRGRNRVVQEQPQPGYGAGPSSQPSYGGYGGYGSQQYAPGPSRPPAQPSYGFGTQQYAPRAPAQPSYGQPASYPAQYGQPGYPPESQYYRRPGRN